MSKSLDTALLELEEDVITERSHEDELRRNLEDIEREFPLEPLRPVFKTDQATYELIDKACVGLTQDAQDFINCLFWLMTAAGYTDDSRSLVIALFAFIDRHDTHEEGDEITDAKLATFMGCSERTVRRKRAKYLKESHGKLQILAITEGAYDKLKKRNRPTRYLFISASLVADAVLEARGSQFWGTDYKAALYKASYNVYDSIRKEQQAKIPSAIRRRIKKAIPIESKIHAIVETIKTKVKLFRELESQISGDASREWKKLRDELDSIINGNSSEVVANSTVGSMGGQNVHPSIPDVAVVSEMPVDAPVSEYWRVPSIARAMRDNGESPPNVTDDSAPTCTYIDRKSSGTPLSEVGSTDKRCVDKNQSLRMTDERR